MPNAKVHAQIGAAAGAITYVAVSKHYKRKMDLLELGACTLAGMACAALPDIIEPALTPNHRGAAHSVTILVLLLFFVLTFCRDDEGERDQLLKIVVCVAGVGYGTHLLADSCTPMGLPLFG